jgi:hypothetical protein
MAILREEGWNLIERFDLNHVVQSWKKMFQSHRKVPINKPGEKLKCRDVLRGLEIPLLKWFHTIVKLDNDLEAKTKRWLGAYEFYVFPPRDLPHGRFVWKNRQDEVCRGQLTLFLNNSAELLAKCQNRISTQGNESLHAMKAKLADKNFNWKTTWRARCCTAILDMNDEGWKLKAYEEQGFGRLDYEILDRIEADEAAKAKRHLHRCEPDIQKKERTRRWNVKDEQRMRTVTAARKKQLGHAQSQPPHLDSGSGDDTGGKCMMHSFIQPDDMWGFLNECSCLDTEKESHDRLNS